MRTNFIGNNIFFTVKELNKIKQQETAKTEIDSPHPLMGKFMRMARAVNNKFKE